MYFLSCMKAKYKLDFTVSPYLLFTQLLPKCFYSTSANFYILKKKNMGVVDVASSQAHLNPYVLLYTPSGCSFADSSFFLQCTHKKCELPPKAI